MFSSQDKHSKAKICHLNKVQLFLLLRRHIKLSERRSVVYEQNKTAKVVLYVIGAFVIIYLVSMSIMLALAANQTKAYTPYEIMFGLLPFVLTADFFLRFIAQQTPSQLIKPYSTLPLPKYTCVELFVISSIITPNNLIWMAFTIPYTIMTVLFSEGLLAAIGLVLAFQLMVIVNSQWYMFIRTQINQSVVWWLLPVLVYGILAYLTIFVNLDAVFDFFARIAEGFVFWNPLNYLCVLILLFLFAETNKRVQYYFTYNENASVEKNNVSELQFINRFGDTSEYIKIEIKSIMRNKNIRKTFIFSTCFVVFLSLVISFTDIYEDSFSRVFWVVYTFVLYGSVSLIKVMCAEGNYIDGLMVHKENIIQILRAKYYLYSTLLLLPLLFMLPTVFTGKYTLLTLVSMLLFTAGPIFCMLMQMAVYNRQTISLNTRFISKSGLENNYFQVVAELIAMFAPVATISLCKIVLSETATSVVLSLVGLLFIATHKLWINNIYKRLMQRRYENMEGFRSTR